jgi:hypothetical protein
MDYKGFIIRKIPKENGWWIVLDGGYDKTEFAKRGVDEWWEAVGKTWEEIHPGKPKPKKTEPDDPKHRRIDIGKE